MSDEKASINSKHSGINKEPAPAPHIAPYTQMTGWRKVYYSPLNQIILLGFILFMGPGLFNALNGLGAGGQVDSETSANGNSALYSTFAVTAFFAGSIHNKLGSRLTLLLGSLGYSLYIGSYLAMDKHPNAGPFVIAASAILGVCAGLLWTAHGALVLAYPTEQNKGLYISICWSVFNLGAVIGASVALGQNIHSKANSVGTGTYVGFLILTLIGAMLPMVMADPKKVYRKDGTKVTVPRNPSWTTEFLGQYLALRNDPMIVLLLPMFLASNWFYTWQFNNYNGTLFTIRGRAVNNLVYWLSQIVGSVLIGLLLDSPKVKRRARAFIGAGVLFIMVFIVHIWAYFYQRDYYRTEAEKPSFQRIDLEDKSYPAHIWLYIFCGLLDSMWQTAAYWMMGAMSNDPAKLAHFTGLYKSMQSAGGAIAWRLDATKTPYMNIFLSTWVLLAAGLLFALPMLYLRVKDHTSLEEETLARLDDHGNLRTAEEVQAELDHEQAAAVAAEHSKA